MKPYTQIASIIQGRLESYLADLQTLVSIDSGPYDKAGANVVNDWLEDHLTKQGFAVRRYAQSSTGDNLVATLQGTGQARILLLGHSDTVYPAGTAAQRPISIEADKILGPGTCDMKAGLLTGIYAIGALQEVDFKDFDTLTYLCVSDEELDNRASIPLIRETVQGQNAVLTLEAARENGDIVTERKGNTVLWVTAHGRSAHAGVEPEKGRNAIMGLVRKLEQIEALAQPEKQITVNIGVINGGAMPNVVPDEARVAIDIRAFHQSQLDIVRHQIEAILDQPDNQSIRFTVAHDDASPPMPRTSSTERLEQQAQQVARELGFDVRGASTGGAADAAFAAAEGIPALDGLGPIGGLDHSPDEYILKSSIVPRTALLAGLIMLICGEKDG